MGTNGTFRFLVVTTALLLWVGAIATANQSETEEGVTPPVAAAPAAEEEAAVAEEADIGEAATEDEAPAEQPDENPEE